MRCVVNKEIFMKSIVLVLTMLALIIAPLAAADGELSSSDSAKLHMESSVSRNAGVNIPENADLVGNLLIEYSQDGNEWRYVSSEQVRIEDLGSSADTIYLRASYYGNEPVDYDCNVAFSTSGWNRTGSRIFDVQSRVAGGAVAALDDENADLAIDFTNLRIDYPDTFESAGRARGNGTRITVSPGSLENSFSIHVPVQSPINGRLVATIEAGWGAADLPSGEYAADIQVAVSANN